MKTSFHRLSAFCSTLLALTLTGAPARAADPEDYDLNEIEILRPAGEHTWFQAASDTDFHYTSNELLMPDNDLLPARQDGVFSERLSLGLTPPMPLRRLTGELYFREQFLRYREHPEYNFNNQTAGFRLSHPVRGGFLAYGGVAVERYVQCSGNNEFFRAADAQAGVWREDPVCSFLTVDSGYQFDWRPTSPAEYARIDNALFLGTSARLADALTARLIYHPAVRSYTRDEHSDFNQLLTAQLKYEINAYAALTLYASYGSNASERSDDNYSVFDAGTGLRIAAKF